MEEESWEDPDKGEKSFGEKFILPIVVVVRVMTSWYTAIVWGFFIPYFMGVPLLNSIMLALFTSFLAWSVWRDDTLEEMINGRKQDVEDPDN